MTARSETGYRQKSLSKTTFSAVQALGSEGGALNMSTTIRIPLVFLFLLSLPSLLAAQSVSLPPVDLGASSFRDGVGGPGLLLQERVQGSNTQNSHSRLYMQQMSYITKREFRITNALLPPPPDFCCTPASECREGTAA